MPVRERSLRAKNRMREIRSSGSVRGGDGNTPAYSAGRLGDAVAGEQLVEAGIAVGMDDAAELPQMRPRMFALAIRRIEEQRRRRALAGKGPLVANLSP